MCEKKLPSERDGIDPCLRDEIKSIKTPEWIRKYQGVFSCCGHGKYSKIFIVHDRTSKKIFDWFSKVDLTNVLKFRQSRILKDADGYYYSPEVEELSSKNV